VLSYNDDCIEDPCAEISQLARRMELASSKLKFLPLAEQEGGREVVGDHLRRALRTAAVRGHWLVLTGAELNARALRTCAPLSRPSRLPSHPDFRLWLSAKGLPRLGEHVFLPTIRCQPDRMFTTVQPQPHREEAAFLPHGLLSVLRPLHRSLAEARSCGSLGWRASSYVPTGWIERRVAKEAKRALPQLVDAQGRQLGDMTASGQLLTWLLETVYYPGISCQEDLEGLKIDLREMAMVIAESGCLSTATGVRSVRHLTTKVAFATEAAAKESFRMLATLAKRREEGSAPKAHSRRRAEPVLGASWAKATDGLRQIGDDTVQAVLRQESVSALAAAENAAAVNDQARAEEEMNRLSALTSLSMGMALDLRLLSAPQTLLAALRAGAGLKKRPSGELEIVVTLDESAAATGASNAVAEVVDRGLLCEGLALFGPAEWTSNAEGVAPDPGRRSCGRTPLGRVWLSSESRERLSVATHPVLRLYHGPHPICGVRVRAPKLDSLTRRMIRLVINGRS